MFNKQLKKNIKALDEQIGELTLGLTESENSEEYNELIKTIEDLTKIRNELSNNKVNESYSKEIISGAIGIAGMVLVLKHEKTEIITTKAFSMATKLFRG